jgi:peptidoglycan/xylan/chitin deacetylase (PgdA/CDA1 family)
MAPLATILRYDIVLAPSDRTRRAPGWSPAASPTPLMEVDTLRRQLDRVAEEGRPVVTVGAIARALEGKERLPDRALALTFDDGLADHHAIVLPLLRERGLIASFFLAPETIHGGRVMEAHKIHFLLAAAEDEDDVVAAIYDALAEHGRMRAAPFVGKPPWQRQSTDRATRQRDIAFITRLLRSALPAALRAAIIRRLFRTFVTTRERSFAGHLYLTPDQARDLARSGMEIGGYGGTGGNLQGVPDPEQAAELAAAAAFLTDDLGCGPPYRRLFAYPGGGWDEVTLDLLPRYGFAAAVTNHPGAVRPGTDRFLLPRYPAITGFETAMAP